MELWQILLVYVVVLHIASLLCALILYGMKLLYKDMLEKKSFLHMSVLWIIVNSITIILSFNISVACFTYLQDDTPYDHALWLSILCFCIVLLGLPYMHKRIKANHSLEDDTTHKDNPIYK